MTGPEHYRTAELLAKSAARYPDATDAPVLAQLAQAHATLALTAATAMSCPGDGLEGGLPQAEFQAWAKATASTTEGGAR